MKRVILLGVTLVFILSSVNTFAQKLKLGYVEVEEIITIIPDKAKAQAALTEYSKELEGQLQTMNQEFEKKYQEYETNYQTWGEAVRKDKEKEITSLQQRIQEFQVSAQQDLQAKEQELLQPIYNKINEAIKQVGDENGYTYIYDNSTLLYKSDDAENITDQVKTKLGL